MWTSILSNIFTSIFEIPYLSAKLDFVIIWQICLQILQNSYTRTVTNLQIYWYILIRPLTYVQGYRTAVNIAIGYRDVLTIFSPVAWPFLLKKNLEICIFCCTLWKYMYLLLYFVLKQRKFILECPSSFLIRI